MNENLLSREQVRLVDRVALDEYHVPGILLMENAGRGAAEVLIGAVTNEPVVICCGRGNNGGDGFVIARHLENHGVDVRVLLFADPERLAGDALANYRILSAAGTPLLVIRDLNVGVRIADELASAAWICDALLGTGMTGEVREPYATAIEAINNAPGRVLAVDVPSGLDCDSGKPLGCCVRADVTATFVAAKPGFASAAEYVGRVEVIDIGVPRCVIRRVAGANLEQAD